MNPGGIEAEICVRIRHQRLEVVLLFHESLFEQREIVFGKEERRPVARGDQLGRGTEYAKSLWGRNSLHGKHLCQKDDYLRFRLFTASDRNAPPELS